MTDSPKRLLLIGGGHAHLFVLEALRRTSPQRRAGLVVSMLTDTLQTPYSGMLPGLVAGHYRTKECHIDLQPLAVAAGVELIEARVDRLDLTRNVACAGQQAWPFDLVSLDIGSVPPLHGIAGADQVGVAVKPIGAFLAQWRALQSGVDQLVRPVHLVMVGGGAGGIELLLAMAYWLRGRTANVKWSLVCRGELLPGAPRRAAAVLAARLKAAGVALRTDCAITRVASDRIHFADGSEAAFDQLLWATGAAAQEWPGAAGLA
ncbi:MAG: FAD-dependent oxidoreductase, partial [Pseudomonadota bacterium]|nr:FAD-dependent oxidoreductase [Pseudomonadota bacterium]